MLIEAKIANRLQSLAEKGGYKTMAYWMPSKAALGGAERDLAAMTFDTSVESDLLKVYREHGFKTIELMQAFRVIQPQLAPLFSEGNEHMLYKGQQWAAFLLAEKLLLQIEK